MESFFFHVSGRKKAYAEALTLAKPSVILVRNLLIETTCGLVVGGAVTVSCVYCRLGLYSAGLPRIPYGLQGCPEFFWCCGRTPYVSPRLPWQNGVVSAVVPEAGKCSCNQKWGFTDYFMAPIKAYNENEIFMLFKIANSNRFWIDTFLLIVCCVFLEIINCLQNCYQVMH